MSMRLQKWCLHAQDSWRGDPDFGRFCRFVRKVRFAMWSFESLAMRTHTHEYRRREAETVLSGSRRLKTYISLLSDRYTRPQVRVSTRNAGRQSLSVDFAHAETGCCNSLREVLQFALGLRQPFTWALAGVATWPWQAKPFTWALASAVTWFWCRANPFTWVLASVVTQPCVLNS